jgi:serine/threonine protein kinase
MPDYVANVILKCLEREPENRYQSAREILNDLETQNAPALSAPSQTQTIKIQRPRRLSPWLVFGAGVALAIAILFLLPRTRHLILRSPANISDTGQVAIEHYLAILPLRVEGDEQNTRYIADGVVDELSA